jgi:LacI family transcriptional regulator
MQKVADTAGVSVSTVSRIFNSPDFAKQETRESVIAAAQKVGYRVARRRDVLMSGDSSEKSGRARVGARQIILLAPEQVFGGVNSPDWIFRDVVPTLQRVARDKGFQLILYSYGAQDDPQFDLSSIAKDRVFGVLWLANGQYGELLSRIARSAPIVVINDDAFWPPRASVMSNNRAVAFKAVEYLSEQGHRRIAYFDADESPNVSVHSRERLSEYHEAMTYFKLEFDPELVVQERFGMNEHPQAVARAMDRLIGAKSKPTALIAPLGYAIQFLKETRKRGIRVPDDLSVLAIDDAPVASLVEPSLTVIDCGFAGCAEMAVELLMEQADPARRSAKTVLLEPRLITRNSTAAPPLPSV